MNRKNPLLRYPSTSLLWLAVLLLPILGCRGCNSDPQSTTQDPNAKNKNQKQRLVADELRTLPFSSEIAGNAVKPGHWYQTRHKLKANFGDESLVASMFDIDKQELPMPPWAQGIPLQFERNVSLAKGQEKTIELKVLQPDEFRQTDSSGFASSNVSLFTRYALRGLGSPILEESFLLKAMPEYQYDLLILSREVSPYTFWRGLDCIVWPLYEPDEKFRVTPHRIIDIPESELPNSIPNQLATMTSISHIVLNDAMLGNLTTEQQSALLDWLHFGGTLILNGPDAIGSIENSFLRPYAPLQQTSTSLLSVSMLDTLNNSWSLRFSKGERIPFANETLREKALQIPVLNGSLATTDDQKSPLPAQWVDQLDGLVAERFFGQGRVVMTTFPMTNAMFVNWPSYSALIHNGILRKPPRIPSLGLEPVVEYDGDLKGTEMSPIHNTRLRIWARDLDPTTMRNEAFIRSDKIEEELQSPDDRKKVGFGAWNASSHLLISITDALRESSGITVPMLSTVLKWLAAYLIVLVPLNWLLFRLIGKLEYAWLAAPLIALAGVFVIARGVRLDVGFTRSQNTIQFLELHNHYPRGVLSSYHALYSSLTTNYQAVFSDNTDNPLNAVKASGVLCPMPAHTIGRTANRARMLEYKVADEKGNGFHSFPVLSNTTGMLQSEEMVELSGSISITPTSNLQSSDPANPPLQWNVTNNSPLNLKQVAVLGIDSQNQFQLGWVEAIPPNSSLTISPTPQPNSQRTAVQWQVIEDPAIAYLLQDISKHYPLGRNEWIALGWMQENASRLQVTPASLHSQSKTIVLLHLTTASPAPIKHDVRLYVPTQESNLEFDE